MHPAELIISTSRRHIQAAVVALLVLCLSSPAWAQQPDLAVGQEWSIKAAPPSSAKVVIGRIETINGREIVSVSIIDVPTDHGPSTVGHAPFEMSALLGSLDSLIATRIPTDSNFEQGYQQWKSANGGYFTIGVARAIEAIRPMLNKAAPRPAAPTS
jgi:hypothetical protein